jgi:hypothetical protein
VLSCGRPDDALGIHPPHGGPDMNTIQREETRHRPQARYALGTFSSLMVTPRVAQGIGIPHWLYHVPIPGAGGKPWVDIILAVRTEGAFGERERQLTNAIHYVRAVLP